MRRNKKMQIYEDIAERFNVNSYLIKVRCLELREEVKKHFADMGIKWLGRYTSDTQSPLDELIELKAFMKYDIDKDITDTRKVIEEHGSFIITYPLPSGKYGMSELKAVLMTEEEVMQRKMLKEMGIEQ
jgi:hypothetical protein